MAQNFIIDPAVARELLKILELREEIKEKELNWALSIIRQIPGYEKTSIAQAAQDRALKEILVAIASEQVAPTSPRDLEALVEEAKKREALEKEARLKGKKEFIPGIAPRAGAETKAPPLESAEKTEEASFGIRISPSSGLAVVGLFKKVVLWPLTLPANYFLKAGASAVYGGNKDRQKALSGLTPFTLRVYGVESKKLKNAISSAQEAGRISEETAKKLLEVVGSIKKVETGSPWYIRTVFWAYGGNQVSLITDLGKLQGVDLMRNFLMTRTQDGAGLFIKDVAGAIGEKAIGGAIKKGVEGLLTKLGVSVAAEGTAAVAGGPIGIIVAAVIEIGKKILSWVKRMIQKHKDVFYGLFGAGLMAVGYLTGSLPLTIAGGLGVGFGVAGSFGYSPGAVVSSAAGTVSAGILGLTTLVVSSLSAAAIVAIASVPVMVAIILFIINSGAYLVPPAPRIATALESPFVGVEKKVAATEGNCQSTASASSIECDNSFPVKVDYEVTVTAKTGPLTNISFENICRVTKEGPVPTCDAPTPAPPATISPTQPFVFSYSATYGQEFGDASITDIFTVRAEAADEGGVSAAASANVKIGSPPEECPSSWPIDQGYVTQGAYSPPGYSHSSLEAIDVGATLRPVFAGHSGTVAVLSSSCLGNYIEITSSCVGKDFKSQYAHLEGVSVQSGQAVSLGEQIGLSGNTGTCTSGPHLHYEFRYTSGAKPSYPSNPPYMLRPYVPKDVPRGCTSVGQCSVSIP